MLAREKSFEFNRLKSAFTNCLEMSSALWKGKRENCGMHYGETIDQVHSEFTFFVLSFFLKEGMLAFNELLKCPNLN